MPVSYSSVSRCYFSAGPLLASNGRFYVAKFSNVKITSAADRPQQRRNSVAKFAAVRLRLYLIFMLLNLVTLK